jgi:hypothetical protein
LAIAEDKKGRKSSPVEPVREVTRPDYNAWLQC